MPGVVQLFRHILKAYHDGHLWGQKFASTKVATTICEELECSPFQFMDGLEVCDNDRAVLHLLSYVAYGSVIVYNNLT